MTRWHNVMAGITALFLALPTASALAQSNVALVIGNGAYQSVKPLSSAVADASLVAQTMRAAGYDVTEMQNVQQRDNGQILNNLLNKIAEAGGGATVFFYYIGHAAQLDGDNYLIPVDVSTTGPNDVRSQSLRLGQVLEELAKMPAVARVVVLDASYEHGIRRGDNQPVPPGLTIMQAPAGMAIISAAAPGEVATAEAGTYTRTLVGLMRQPGLELDQVLKAARQQVNQVTGGKQTPWSTTALLSDVTLIPAPPAAPPAPAAALPVPAVAPPAALPAAALPTQPPAASPPPAAERTERPSKKEQRRQAERPRRERAPRESAGSAQVKQAPAAPAPIFGGAGISIGRRGIGIGVELP